MSISLSDQRERQYIKAAFGEGTASESTAAHLYKRFASGDETLEDVLRAGRLSKVDNEELKALVETDPIQREANG